MKNKIKILGAYGSKTFDKSMTCVQVDNNIIIDAGNIMGALGNSSKYIDHIFLSHTHLDHIVDIPFLIDNFFSVRTKPLMIYGLKDTIEHIKKYLFNWDIWPDFSAICLIDSEHEAIKFQTIELNEEITVNNTTLKAIKTEHTDSSCGYVITKNNKSVLFTADTYKSPIIWDEVNNNPTINSVIIDVSFPSDMETLAINSKHLTPKLLSEDLELLNRKDVKIFVNHLKPTFIKAITQEFKTDYKDILQGGKILKDGDELNFDTVMVKSHPTLLEQHKQHMEQLIEIGHSLTSEKDFDTLMEKILLGAKQISGADGGTLYMLSEDEKSLEFHVVQTDSLGIKMGGTSSKITWPNVQLCNEDGSKNMEQVAAVCAITGELINIPDVYEAEGFNFEGTKKFDHGTGYRTKSMLVIPMIDHENNVIGVLQLLNKQNGYGRIVNFNKNDEKIIASMASQAAVSITNNRLIENLETLLTDFIKSIADAINEKSKYTAGHINRVAELASLIAHEINNDTTGPYKDVFFDEDQLKQLDIAAWMHDMGKITTPEYVVDKATKLETIHDRIHTIIAKFEVLKRDKKMELLEGKITQEQYDNIVSQIDDDLAFIKETNKGGEFMSDDKIDRLKEIAKQSVVINGETISIIDENELYNLSIKRGTLTNEERNIINNHVVVSYNMLNKLSFPKKLSRVALIAGSHHKMVKTDENGKHGGYGAPEIMNEPMILEDRILAIADVFEAVTASDRPYKEPNSLNQSLNILNFMVKDEALDKDLVKFFVNNKIYEKYTSKNLKPEQIDEVTVVI